jgi:hypothetical protein
MYFCFSCLIIFCRCLLRIFQSWLSISKFLKREKDVLIAKGKQLLFPCQSLISMLVVPLWMTVALCTPLDPINCWWVRTRLCCMNASASKHHSEPYTPSCQPDMVSDLDCEWNWLWVRPIGVFCCLAGKICVTVTVETQDGGCSKIRSPTTFLV